MTAVLVLPTQPCLKQLQASFLGIVPIIRRHGRVYFRLVACGEKKEDLIEEMVALAWKWFVRLAQKSKDATQFPSVLASFAAPFAAAVDWPVRNEQETCSHPGPSSVMASW